MKTYFIKTFGCQMNASDSEKIEGILLEKKYKPAGNIEQADILVINCCSVRQSAIDRVYGLVNRWKSKKSIILAGCILETDKKKLGKYQVNFWHPDEYFMTPLCQKNNFQALVPIMTGCDNFCSYCVVPYSRGREKSRPAKKIISEIKKLVKNDAKEIILLGQNVNSYGDKKIGFSQLLKKVDSIPGHFWLRFLTSHPKDMNDELIKTIAKSKKICEYVHLPIQAGDDEILRKMNRKYTSKHYLSLIRKLNAAFKKQKPKVLYSISTDIIVGFPEETRNQFAKSADIMKKVGFDMVYIGQYSPRVGTNASKMKDAVAKNEKTRRKKYLDKILKKTASTKNKRYLGSVQEILVEHEKNGFYFGKTRTMKDVRFCNDENDLVGKFVKVKITKVGSWNLEGKIEG